MNKYCKKMANGGSVNEDDPSSSEIDPLEKANQDFEAAQGGTSAGSYGPGNGDDGQDMEPTKASSASFNDRREGNSDGENSRKPKTKPKPKPQTKSKSKSEQNYSNEARRTGSNAGSEKPKNQSERDTKNYKDFEDTPLVRGVKSVGSAIKGMFDGSKSNAVKIADLPKGPGVYDNALKFNGGGNGSTDRVSEKRPVISMEGVNPKTLLPNRKMANGGVVGYGGQSVQSQPMTNPTRNVIGGSSNRSYKK